MRPPPPKQDRDAKTTNVHVVPCGSVLPIHSPRSHTAVLWPTSRFPGDRCHIEVPLDSTQAEVNEAESKKLHCSVQIAGYDRSPALVAQLDRAPDYGSGGWGFESLQARRSNPPPLAGDFLVLSSARTTAGRYLLARSRRPQWPSLRCDSGGLRTSRHP